MDRRFLLAVGLMVVVGPSLFLKRPPVRPPAADTTSAQAQTPAPAQAEPAAAPARSARSAAPGPTASYDTASLATADATYRFTTRGAALEQATFSAFKS